MLRGVTFLLSASLSLPALASGPPPIGATRSIDLTHGLSETHLRSITQDRDGFLWFATLDGLNRYDGYEIRRFAPEPGNPRSLGGNLVYTLHVDGSGTLWVGTTGGGLNRYDPLTEGFEVFRNVPEDPDSLAANDVHSIRDDGQGSLWVATSKGLDRMDLASGRFRHYRHDANDPRSLTHDVVYSVVESRDGTLWVGTAGGLDRMERTDDGARFIHYRHDPQDPGSLAHDAVNALYEGGDQTIWIGTWGGGLDALDPDRETFVHYGNRGLDATLVRSILEDRDGRVWVGTANGGLYVRENGSELFHAYRNDSAVPMGLPHDNVVAVFEDREGLLWVGTGGGGVNVIDPHRKPFASPGLGSSGRVAGVVGDVRAIEEDREGILWVGTFGKGLQAIDEERDLTIQYLHDPAKPDSLSGNVVLSLDEGTSGDLWVGTSAGLDRFDRATETFRHFEHDPNDEATLGDSSVVALLEDVEAGVYWIGTAKGLDHLDLETETITRHAASSQERDPRHVYMIRRDETGALWLARPDGLDRFDPSTQRFQHFSLSTEPQSHTAVWAVHVVGDHQLWLGTSRGLLLFDTRLGTVTPHNEGTNDSPAVAGILEADDGRLWLGGSRGLARYDPETRELRRFSSSDTGTRLSFAGAAIESRSGRFYFGAGDGLLEFVPSRIHDNSHVPPVVLTNLLIEHRPVGIAPKSLLSQSITRTERLRIEPDHRVISFEFTSLSYRDPAQNRYAYRLDGFDSSWTEVDSRRRQATYTNLPPGSYVFRVKGSNNDGVWNEAGVAVGLDVLPSWWQTTWFRLGGLLIAAFALLGMHRLRLGAIQDRAERDRSVLESLTSHIALLDRDARITAVNARWFTFVNEMEPERSVGIGDDYLGVLRRMEDGDSYAGKARLGIESVLEGASEQFNLEYPRGSGSEMLWYSLLVVPFRGRERGAVVSYTDITERKRADEEAQKRREELAHVSRVVTVGELTASIAHEINQPLASIVTYANAGRRFVDRGASTAEQLRGILVAIAEQGKRAGDIVLHLRALLSKGRVERAAVDVNELLRAVLELVRGDALARRVSISDSLASELPRLAGDAIALQQVFLNLIANGFEAMTGESTDPREMYFRTWYEDGGTVEIAVRDNGPPITDETFNSMFQRFYTRKPTGMGMGLAISQAIITDHGGTLWAERNPDRGLTMRISLPTQGVIPGPSG